MNRSLKMVTRVRRQAARGFTLIELLVVLVILGILAAVVVPNLVGKTEKAKVAAAKADISNLGGALNNFEVENGRFPSSEEGLQALVEKPGDLPNWKHSYIDKLPPDPWGHPYVYRCPGNNGKDYDLVSGGPDGHEGGDDDITNH
ncbi:MAG TPA: type II secretion system major pseudopilin GspG [Tepidisphaeraceae bacterium]|nr:type II secretion system major pseudopilin GspG [Tepidisphaeraceae bacterium]